MPLFNFSLVRQFPNEEEEYCQIHLDIQYKPSEKNQSFENTVWDADIEEDIFDHIKNSKEYLSLVPEDIYKINAYMDET